MADNKRANIEKFRKAFGDEAADKLGNFQEAPGGGKPLGKGEKAPSKDWVQKNRKMQPRDDEGKFTYNAVNLKPLKYGPSRGKTTPPIVKNEAFEKIFNKKEAVMVDNNNRTKVIVNDEYNDFLSMFKEYNNKRGFGFKTETKKGRWSKEEKAASELSQKLGKQAVVNKEKFNKVYDEKNKDPKPDSEVKKETPKPTEQPKEEPVNLKQTVKQNKELIGQIVELGISPADAAKIVAIAKVQNIEQFKQMMGL